MALGSSFWSLLLAERMQAECKAHWHLSSLSEGVPSRGRPWRDLGPQSACTSVVSVSLLLVALSRKLARGGLTFTPCAVTEPSMAFRSWKGKSQIDVCPRLLPGTPSRGARPGSSEAIWKCKWLWPHQLTSFRVTIPMSLPMLVT